MENIKYVLFDLDGTLTDSEEGITNSARYALKKMNVEPKGDLRYFIGPPLYETFKEHYDFSQEESDRAISFFREYFSTKGVFEHKLYDGILNTLKTLKERGKTLVLATSKPEVFAVSILKQYKIDGLFSFICGATMDESRTEKTDVIKYALKNIKKDFIKNNPYNIEETNLLDSCVMIGDRRHDIVGAKNCGLKSIGVTFGFGSLEELKAAEATEIASTPEEILSIIK